MSLKRHAINLVSLLFLLSSISKSLLIMRKVKGHQNIVQSQKIIYPYFLHRRDWNFPRGWGFWRTKIFKQIYGVNNEEVFSSPNTQKKNFLSPQRESNP